MRKLLIPALLINILFVSCSSKADILNLKGDIYNNIISTTSVVSGRIIQMNKKQGEPVKKGELIALIDNANQIHTVEQFQAVVNAKRAKLDELKAGTRIEQIEQAEAQVNAAKAQFDLLTSGSRIEQISQAKSNVSVAGEAVNAANVTRDYLSTKYADYLKLYKDLSISKNELDDMKYKLDSSEKQVALTKYQLESAKHQLELLQNGSAVQSVNAARANYDAANAQLRLLQSGPTKQTIDAAQADLEQSLAQLAQAQNTLNNYNVVALADGLIESKNFELGDVVNVGSNIADIAVANDVYVLCYIPNEYLDKVYFNEPVNVATSLGTQVGKISYISLKNEYTPKDKKSTSDEKRIAAKMKVSIDDKGGRLKSGLTASVDIPLDVK